MSSGAAAARDQLAEAGPIGPTTDAVQHGNAQDAIDAIESRRARTWAEHDAQSLPTFQLPGHGSMYDDCGDKTQHRMCDSCGEAHTVSRTCRRSRCPRCGSAWARERAMKAAAKLEGHRRRLEAQADQWTGNKFHHLIHSPDMSWLVECDDPIEALDRTFEAVKDQLRALGCEEGGVIFFHPFRGKNGDDRGFWKWLLFNGDDQQSWKATLRKLVAEGHFHSVVLADHIDGGAVTRRIESETGWVVHRVTKGDSSVSIGDLYDLARVTTYCTSHVGLRELDDGSMRGTIRYFGDVQETPATEQVKREVDAATRSVAPRTLGLEYSSLACTRDVSHGDGATTAVDLDAAAVSRTRHRAPRSTAPSDTPSTTDFGTPAAQLVLGSESRLELPERTVDLPDEAVETIAGIMGPLEPAGGLEVASDLPELVKGLLSDEIDVDDLPSSIRGAAREITLSAERVEADLELGVTRDGPGRDDGDHCAGRLLDIREAYQYLSDQEWIDDADHWKQTARAYAHWCEKHDRDPHESPQQLTDRALETVLEEIDGPPPG